ncbi:hypothetical protein FV232_22705 [Methylobacterium sp. WL30]|nr:hypothetical protein FV227_14740 [Methylobacterium sp. WL119]TXN63677.1 hypothetical protein FV232_22705 [Methylobacterium sp. WL30]
MRSARRGCRPDRSRGGARRGRGTGRRGRRDDGRGDRGRGRARRHRRDHPARRRAPPPTAPSRGRGPGWHRRAMPRDHPGWGGVTTPSVRRGRRRPGR